MNASAALWSEYELSESDLQLKRKKLAIRQELHKQRVIVNEYESNVSSVGYVPHDEEAQRREEFTWYQEQYEVMQNVFLFFCHYYFFAFW